MVLPSIREDFFSLAGKDWPDHLNLVRNRDISRLDFRFCESWSSSGLSFFLVYNPLAVSMKICLPRPLLFGGL